MAVFRFNSSNCVVGRGDIYRPDFQGQLLAQIEQLEGLTANWDGEGAAAPIAAIIRKTAEWVRRLPSGAFTYPASASPLQPAAVPLANGTVQVEFHGPGQRILELEFGSGDMLGYLRWDPADHTSDEGEISIFDIDRLAQFIDWSKNRAGDA